MFRLEVENSFSSRNPKYHFVKSKYEDKIVYALKMFV